MVALAWTLSPLGIQARVGAPPPAVFHVRLDTNKGAILLGETAGGGIRGGKQGPLFAGGNEYLAREFPRLAFIERARLVER
jgi:hypothetical protein